MQIANLYQSEVRIIQYLGSKLQILDEIEQEIDSITPVNGTVCDLFAGSGAVSNRLSSKYQVYANDTQHYSEVLLKVLLDGVDVRNTPNYEEIISSKYYKGNYSQLSNIFADALAYEKRILESEDYEGLRFLRELNLCYDASLVEDEKVSKAKEIYRKAFDEFSINNIQRLKRDKSIYELFTLYYSTSYFSIQQCIEIDSIRATIDGLYFSKKIESRSRDYLLACLLHSISEIVSSVGKNFAQPIKVVDEKGNLKSFAIKRCMKDRRMELKESFIDIFNKLSFLKVLDSNKVFCTDAYSLVSSGIVKEVDTFYLDPPYTIDHYSRFYHIPETLVLYDYPELERKKVKGKYQLLNGRYRNDRYQSDFCIPSEGKGALKKLMGAIANNGSQVILSYSEDDEDEGTRKRVISKEEILEIMREYFSSVEVKNVEHRYRKLNMKNSNRKEMHNSELLIVGK